MQSGEDEHLGSWSNSSLVTDRRITFSSRVRPTQISGVLDPWEHHTFFSSPQVDKMLRKQVMKSTHRDTAVRGNKDQRRTGKISGSCRHSQRNVMLDRGILIRPSSVLHVLHQPTPPLRSLRFLGCVSWQGSRPFAHHLQERRGHSHPSGRLEYAHPSSSNLLWRWASGRRQQSRTKHPTGRRA